LKAIVSRNILLNVVRVKNDTESWHDIPQILQ